jgi:integrase
MATVKKKINKKGVVYRVDWYTPEGRRKRKDFDLKKDAEAWKGAIDLAKRENRYDEVFDVKKENPVTFNELADRYQENFQNQRAFQTLKRYFLLTLREHFGDHQLSQITYFDLETYRNRRQSTPTRAGKPRTPATVNREMTLMRHMLNKAVEWGMLTASPLDRGKRLMLQENNHRLRFLTEDEIGRLISASAPHLAPIIEVAIHTGMRRGELLGLKWEQIRHGFIYLTETKTGKPRQIPVNDRVARVFKELRKKHQMKSPYVFLGPDGVRLHGVKRSFENACRRAGIEGFRFHDLRHTFASHLVMNNVSLKAVQELLGHSDLKMTMRYAHLSQAHLKEAVGALNKLAEPGKDQKKNECRKSVHQ